MTKILGIDYGTKRIGVAISDESGKFAFPLLIIQSDKNAIAEIKKICEERGIGGIVVGESFDDEGKENKLMSAVRPFAEKLSAETGLPMFYEKEYMTSVEAHRFAFKEQEKKGRQKVDDSAAALILQRYLDKQK